MLLPLYSIQLQYPENSNPLWEWGGGGGRGEENHFFFFLKVRRDEHTREFISA